MAISIPWSDDYCLDETIDLEHKRLFALAEAVFAIEDPKEQLPNVKAAINALCDYVKLHFSNEERYMVQAEYPDHEDHVAMHQAIIARMKCVLTESTNLDELLSALRHLVLDWVLVHIQQEDRKLAPYLRAPAP